MKNTNTKNLIRMLVVFLLMIGAPFANSQCNYPIDTTITPIYYNANVLNSNQVQDSMLCLGLIENTNGSVYIKFIADSEIAIIDWYSITEPGCPIWQYNGFIVTDSLCDTISWSPWGTWTMPYSGWNGSGAKHFDSLTIGATYVAKMDYQAMTGECRGLNFCVWYYSVGMNFLSVSTIKPDNSKIDVYPTTFSTNINIDFNGVQDVNRLTVTSLSGEVVYDKYILSTDISTIDLNSIPIGMYILSIHTPFTIYNKKIIKQ